MPTIKVVGVLAAAIVCGVYLLLALRGPMGIPALQEKVQEIREMQVGNAELKLDVERLQHRIKRLSENPAEQELEIRKNLNLLRRNETLFIAPETRDGAEKKNQTGKP